MTAPSIITTRALAERLGVSRTTLHTWLTTDQRWRRCIVHQTRRKYWLSVQRLTDAGILTRPEAAPSEASIGPSFVYRTQGIA